MARDAPSIDAYGQGGFRLSGARHEGSLLILRDEARVWDVSVLTDATPEALAAVFEAGPKDVELVLLGTGQANGLPPRTLRDGLLKAGIGLEFMDTPAAARLYNLLTAEGRRVAAALIAI